MDSWFVKVSWLGELVSVFWWVELDLFYLECNVVSSGGFWGIHGFGMDLGSLGCPTGHTVFQVVFLLCWRISVVCLSLGLVGFWVELGFSVGMEIWG